MNLYRQTGELIFGSRLKRISEKFLTDFAKVYKTLKINFEISWFPLFYLLKEKGKLSVTEIAVELKITHSAVSQFVTVLEKKKIVNFLNDKNDKRKRLIYFTPKGLALLEEIIPVWESMVRVVKSLFNEGEKSAYILLALNELEDHIKDKSLHSRIINDVKQSQFGEIEIIHYDSLYKNQFKNLILNWLIDNHDQENLNIDIINNPEEGINSGNGCILMAIIKQQCVGIITTQMNEKDSVAEILHFIVDEQWQQRQIGKKLIVKMLEQLEIKKVKQVQIKVNKKFSNAIKLLKKTGFYLDSIKQDDESSNSIKTLLLMEYQIEN